MDLRNLTTRLSERRYPNVIVTFEQGKVVRRTHQTLLADIKEACARLREWGIRPGMRVGICACNCYMWVVYDIALLELKALSVAFTDDFAGRSADELIEKYALSLLLVPASETARKSGRQGASVAFLDGENDGVRAIVRRQTEEDPEFENTGLVFSSGSTGKLKGLKLSRQGVEASVDAFTAVAGPRPDDCLLLFLPISNFQQRLMYYSALWYGFDLIVTDPTRLFRALKELHPTILIAPPILYETFETRFYNLPKWKRVAATTLGNILLRWPGKSLRQRMAWKIFKEAYDALGGKMRFMVTGMAPIKRSTLNFFRLMQLPLFETYGITEFGGVALNLPGANRIGSVGRLLPGVRVELAPDGEVIAVREHRIASTYFECEQGEAEKTFISSDRLATGDVGRFDEDGYLYLVGRKKEMIVTAGGTKIHPEIPEAEIDACTEVARSVVFADQDSAGLVAVVVPKNPQDESARTRIREFIDALNERRLALPIRGVVFSEETFSRENGLLRPNLKLDRKKIGERFLGSDQEAARLAVARSA